MNPKITHVFFLGLIILSAPIYAASPAPAEPAISAQSAIELGENLARTIVSMTDGVSYDELSGSDPRIAKAGAWLAKTAAASGLEEEQVAASSIKLSRYLFDALQVRATPMETLEALARFTAKGKPISDTTAAYFEARKTAAGKSHAEAMAALAKK